MLEYKIGILLSSKMDYLEKFNTTMVEFISDLVKVFPDDMELKMYQLALKGLIVATPNLISEQYHRRVTSQYYDEIVSRNEDFFLNHDFKQVKERVEDGMRIIEKTMNYWSTLSSEDKDTVWKYMKVLCILSKKLHG